MCSSRDHVGPLLSTIPHAQSMVTRPSSVVTTWPTVVCSVAARTLACRISALTAVGTAGCSDTRPSWPIGRLPVAVDLVDQLVELEAFVPLAAAQARHHRAQHGLPPLGAVREAAS